MQLDYLGDLRRTHTCGALRAADAGQRVTLMGWVNRRRDLGNLIFIDLRDRTGMTQVVFDTDQKAVLEKASALRNEFVVAVTGTVKLREGNTVNKKLPTGEIEVVAQELRLLNEAKTPPFSPADAALPNEEVRLKYRYLDLRRAEMQANLELRHQVALAIRNHLSAAGFFEIETPFLTRSTPEGARDFLVPSRVHPGSFYALPQSPQLFKQILMISGCDKYFQIVRCFRDEDLRADRQLEFTQIDLEMTYPQQEQVFAVVEGFVGAAWKAAGVTLETPFPRMTYDEAMHQYGSDKPDLRLPAMTDVKECFAATDLEKLGIAPALPVVAVRIPKVGELSRKERDEIKPLFAAGKPGDAKLFDDWKRLEKNFPDAAAKVRAKTQAAADDLLVIVAGGTQPQEHKSEGGVKPEVKQHDHAVYNAAGLLRVALGQKYAERHKLFAGDLKSADSYRFLWVTDFPMFEWDADGERWAAAHHPFTSPHERDMQKVLDQKDLGSVRANAYDIVLNGTELGSGSIRIHRQDVQRQIFRALGMTEEEAKQRFGFFLEALEYGTPPHGGIALGLDRIVMILAGGDSLREVIPFPKTAKAVDLMVDAPTEVSEQQLDELRIIVATPAKERQLDVVGRLRAAGRTLVDAAIPILEKQRELAHSDLHERIADEVVHGLFARNWRLFQIFVIDFHLWAGDIGRAHLRMMVETLFYLEDLVRKNDRDRFLAFRQYGSGQEKLYKMQLRKMMEAGEIPDEPELREYLESDSDDEIIDELTNVNLGNFDNLRAIAEDAGLKDEYVLRYQPFSINVHGHWPSLAKYNLVRCKEPLHRFHLQPSFSLPWLEHGLLVTAYQLFSQSYEVWRVRYELEDALRQVMEDYREAVSKVFASIEQG